MTNDKFCITASGWIGTAKERQIICIKMTKKNTKNDQR